MKYFLGMEVARSKQGIYVSQKKKYVLYLLKETSMLGCKPVETLIDVPRKNQKSKKEEGNSEEEDNTTEEEEDKEKEKLANKEISKVFWETYLSLTHKT